MILDLTFVVNTDHVVVNTDHVVVNTHANLSSV